MAEARPRLPPWVGAYAAFRFGDGLTSSLIPVAAAFHYDMPLWGLALVVATMNLAGVPAAFLWGKRMERPRRRRVVVTGFAISGLGMAIMASLPTVPIFVLGAVLHTAFGVATGPAASTMILQRVPRSRWGPTTGLMSRLTGFSFLLGMTTSIVLTLQSGWVDGILGTGADVVGGAIDDATTSAGALAAADRLVQSPHFAGQFAAAAVMSLGAAVIALQLIPPWNPPLPHEAGYTAGMTQATVRQFERPVYFPGRLWNIPTLRSVREAASGPVRPWLWGTTLTFTGSVAFFSSYAGVMQEHFLLPAAMVLLASAPSHIVTPITYAWASRVGSRIGETRGVAIGSILRTIALPMLCLLMLFGFKLPIALPAVLALHGVMGLSFAFLQMNGPVILAELHPAGKGAGVGAYHAAVGLGSLLGAAASFVILATLGLGASYVFALGVAGIGCFLLLRAWRTHRASRESTAVVPG